MIPSSHSEVLSGILHEDTVGISFEIPSDMFSLIFLGTPLLIPSEISSRISLGTPIDFFPKFLPRFI